jgi:hypothetical protein
MAKPFLQLASAAMADRKALFAPSCFHCAWRAVVPRVSELADYLNWMSGTGVRVSWLRRRTGPAPAPHLSSACGITCKVT